jgi:NAD dependent epimerase/dehydratase family enzyme
MRETRALKIVLPGGGGQVGNILARHFHAKGDSVVVLARRPIIAPWRSVAWDGLRLGNWVKELNDADVLINLTGRNVNCRYNTKIARKSWSPECTPPASSPKP